MSKSRMVTLFLVLGVSVATTTTSAMANDDCIDAFVAVIDTYIGETSTATNDGSASCGASDSSPDVWYEYTAAEDGTLTVGCCASAFDTVLSLHSGCPGTTANQIACNDDGCGLMSMASADVVTGDILYIRIAGFAGSNGDYTLTLTGPAGVPAGGPVIPEFQRGDSNTDGNFDISDPVQLLAVLFVPGTDPPSCEDAGDVNDDGLLDISDAVFALAALFVAGSPSPDSPFGACGVDPTADSLGCADFAICP